MMIIDFTAELAPVLWTMLGVLVVATGALLASIDPDLAEAYVHDRRLLFVTAVAFVITLGALIVAVPAIATSLGVPLG